jgi:putative addiction module component (TIGR02574 family)
MISQAEIRKLPLPEKLELLEAVWSELSSEPDNIAVPQWHKDILDERQRGLEQGSMKVMDWELAKEQINHRVQ